MAYRSLDRRHMGGGRELEKDLIGAIFYELNQEANRGGRSDK